MPGLALAVQGYMCIVRLHTLELVCQSLIIIYCVVFLSEYAIFLASCASIRLLMIPSSACISSARIQICIVRVCDLGLICQCL